MASALGACVAGEMNREGLTLIFNQAMIFRWVDRPSPSIR